MGPFIYPGNWLSFEEHHLLLYNCLLPLELPAQVVVGPPDDGGGPAEGARHPDGLLKVAQRLQQVSREPVQGEMERKGRLSWIWAGR